MCDDGVLFDAVFERADNARAVVCPRCDATWDAGADVHEDSARFWPVEVERCGRPVTFEEARIGWVEAGMVGELLGAVTLDDIANAWVRFHTKDPLPGTDDDDWWSAELWMSSQWWASEDRVRAGMLKLIEVAPDAVLGNIGAGPLEVFVLDDEERLLWIEDQARSSERFRRTLATVWIWDLPAEVFERVERAAGVPLPRPQK